MKNKDGQSTAERQRERYECYREVFVDIKSELDAGKDLSEVSRQVAERCDVELKTAYEWALDCQQRLERNRKRISVSGLVLLWGALALSVTSGVLWLTRAAPFSVANTGLSALLIAGVSAAVAAAAGITLVAAARRLGARATGPI